MACADFIDAIELVDWLEVESNSSFDMKDKIQILKLELKFLTTFLKYAANRWAEYEDLQDLFNRIEDVGPIINKLASCYKKREVDGAINDLLGKIRLIKPEISGVQMKVLRLSGSRSGMNDELAVKFIDSLELARASGSRSFIKYELAVEFIATLLEDLEELLACQVHFLQPSLKQGIQILKRKLKFLKGLFGFTAKRCREDDKLYQLFTHVQAVVDNASCLAYSCLINDTGEENMADVLVVEVSNLVQKIDPVKPEVREIYNGTLKALKSSESRSNAYERDETAVDFVDSLLENTKELQYRDTMPVKDQIEILYVELTSLKYFLKDVETKPGKPIDLLGHAEDTAIDAGSVIYSLYDEGQVDQDISKEMRFAFSKLLDKFKRGKGLVRKMYVKVEKASISNFPRTDELGAFDLLLQSLKDLLNDRVDSITLLKDHIQIVHRDMEFLRSFMTTIAKLRHEHQNRDDLRWRIIRVLYEVEYAIDSSVVKDGPILHHMLWLSDLIEQIKLIKEEIKELLIHGLQEDVAQTSSSIELTQFNAPRFDEEMVGFKDETERIVEQLVGGSSNLLIVSIVGMPGLGKTFLAHKVYNHSSIKDYFHVRAWCSVSQVYERKGLLINILSQFMRPSNEMSEMSDEDLAGKLFRYLKRRRYLIVLDDIWDMGPWKDLRRSFPDDHNRSRIVFTSQSFGLASQAKSWSIVHHLRQFTDEESWELLQKKISCPLELIGVGKEIAKSCNGLPLAVVVVAGLLGRIGNEPEQWRRVAESLNLYIIGDQRRWWMNILDLSYKNLPDYLKPCFLYFGGLSDNKQILVEKLTWLWIAEGFVQKNKYQNLENIAENYLMHLLDRSLIIASERRSSGGVKACRIHDLIRNFCVSKAKEENFLQLIEGCGDLLTYVASSKDVVAFVPSSSSTSYEQRRLFVHHRQNKKFWSNSSGPCVRSLLFFAPGRKRLRRDEVSSICRGFRLLKVLDLMRIDVGATFPEGIELLVLLKYLAVSGNFSCIPPSITNFRKLESFLVKAIRSLSLPCDIWKLTKLRHLHISGRMSLEELSSRDTSQLDCLQTLSKPILSFGDDMEKMRRFPHLKKLNCVFEGFWDSATNCNRLPILDFLTELESLKVTYQGQMRHPCEFCFPSNIKKLTMSGFRLRWEQISIIENLLDLEVLKLFDEAFEGEEWNVQDKAFPKLKFLKLVDMNFKEWLASDYCFPCLERLILEGCNQLERIPSCLEYRDTLSMILVEDCSDALVDDIKRIQEDQRQWGNEDFKVEIRHRRDQAQSAVEQIVHKHMVITVRWTNVLKVRKEKEMS